MISRHTTVVLAVMMLGSVICEAALASDPTIIADADCVVTGLRMVQMSMPEQRSAGLMLAIYYLGRLDGRASGVEIDSLIEKDAEKMTTAEFRANAVRCGKALTLKGQEIQKIGTDLSDKGGIAPK